MKGSLQLLDKIQHKASDKVLKMCGLLLQPKGSLMEKKRLVAPPNAKKVPLGRVEGHDFKCIGNISFT